MERMNSSTFKRTLSGLTACFLMPASVLAAELASSSALESEFKIHVRPMLEKFCVDCHSTEKAKGDLDLERFSSSREVLADTKLWQMVVEQVGLGEMPPKEKKQPSTAERERLLGWVERALDVAARERAGDPGPVVLRRLNNVEFTYTLRDLTGLESIEPAREFPPDSAAGEGFMNTGNSLVMSPSMFTKYLDAAKEITTHAVLLPDGFRFSSKTTRPDWTGEVLANIRQLYSKFTAQTGGDKVNLQGIVFDTNEGGRLPVERYFRATIKDRQKLAREGAFEAVAQAHGLSPKYLKSFWTLLNSSESSLLLDNVRERWRAADGDENQLAIEIHQWQKALWKFASVGHIGKAGGPTAWMEPANPLSTNQFIRLKLDSAPTNSEVTLYFVATDAGDGAENDVVLWNRPRLVLPGQADLLLRDARRFVGNVSARRDRLFGSTAKALAAIADGGAFSAESDLAALASKHDIHVDDLTAWLNYLGLTAEGSLALEYLTNQIHSTAGYDFVKGWGTGATPSLVANSSDQTVRIPAVLKGRGIVVHPSPTKNIAVGWRSPATDMVRVTAEVTHVHPECGNGVEWFLDLRRGKTRLRLARGVAQGSKSEKAGPIENVSVQKGDFLSLVIGARGGNHSCDSTDIEFVIRDAAAGREWNLTREIAPDVLAQNPRADQFENEATWHFYTEAVSGGSSGPVIPSGSLLAKWHLLPLGAEKQEAANDLQKMLLAGRPQKMDGPDALLYAELSSLRGPLFAMQNRPREEPGKVVSGASQWAWDPALFGKLPNGESIDSAGVAVQAPSVLELRLPADLVAGAELVVEGSLAPGSGAEGSVQLLVSAKKPEKSSGLITSDAKVSSKAGMWTSDNRQISYETPILVNEGTAARGRIEKDLEEFRKWFPAALCYSKIVPVDEVVTLTLYHREDDHLSRLMLNETEKAQLDRLWDELHYISHDAIQRVDAFEQIWQYATQDADPKVFEPLRQPIKDGAAAFRQRLIATEPAHVDALIAFARRAYRRPLTAEETNQLRSLYRNLREKELPHDEAFRVTLARVFVSPAFLYRLEKAPAGTEPARVSDHELASRLSYFLWSSMPDQKLIDLADSGSLRDEKTFLAQARRLLKDARVRRLATEFACAWLHVHDFASLDEKSERHFPHFTELRGPMYEETIRFFTDMFQRDASVLELLDSDYTFLNEDLANHYGIPGVTGPEWRRVNGIKQFSRGGILGHSTILAKQSGASRTSPILRGNWVSEALLGEKLPRPPKDVPQLPADEATENLTVRELVEKHSSDAKCYHCHKRIDGYGFALEGFDAVGRARSKDLGDRPVQTRATLFDGTVVDGLEDLRKYLRTEKRDVIIRQFCRKLLGYSLGRGVILSDKPLIEEMETQLRNNGFRFSAAVETILRSRQFREIRGIDASQEEI
jgi:hypothetical protein